MKYEVFLAMPSTYPDKKAFKRVCELLKGADPDEAPHLTFRYIGDIFGPAFYELILYALLDAQDAARAIQLASARLSGRTDEQQTQ